MTSEQDAKMSDLNDLTLHDFRELVAAYDAVLGVTVDDILKTCLEHQRDALVQRFEEATLINRFGLLWEFKSYFKKAVQARAEGEVFLNA